MNLETQLYSTQLQIWPRAGRHILAQFDADSIVVYQAYNREIGHFAAANQRFGGAWSASRMSWIKPNFLWMMFRSGWGTKENQEVTLAIRLRRGFFDSLLEAAVPSGFDARLYASEREWKSDVARSDVRLQWDPDHNPRGGAVQRRAVQLGLRGEMLRQFASEAIIEIEDISGFVEEQRAHVLGDDLGELRTPRERVYTPASSQAAARLGLDEDCASSST